MSRTGKKSQKPSVGRPKGKPRTSAERAADAKRMGRPILPMEERETKMIALRLTPAEFEAFTKDAKKAGMGRAAYARLCWHKVREMEHGNDIPQSGSKEKSRNGKRGKRL